MFGFILFIIRISLLPLSSTKKELMARTKGTGAFHRKRRKEEGPKHLMT